MKRLIVAVTFIVAALGVAAYVLVPELFSAEGRRARFLRNLEKGPLVVRRSCFSMETFVKADHWAALGAGDRREAAQALAEYCREQGSTGAMAIVDAESRRRLAYWDGSSLTAGP
jgi:hypothetical protein